MSRGLNVGAEVADVSTMANLGASAGAEEVVDRYLADESGERATRAAGQLADLLATAESEEALQAIVRGELGCWYAPTGTMRHWLESVKARLAPSQKPPEGSPSRRGDDAPGDARCG